MGSHQENQGAAQACTKGSQIISEYMQFTDELALLGKPFDKEDLLGKILHGLNDVYKSIINIINGHKIPISFDKLLITKELSLVLLSISIDSTSGPSQSRAVTPCIKTWRPPPPQGNPSLTFHKARPHTTLPCDN